MILRIFQPDWAEPFKYWWHIKKFVYFSGVFNLSLRTLVFGIFPSLKNNLVASLAEIQNQTGLKKFAYFIGSGTRWGSNCYDTGFLHEVI